MRKAILLFVMCLSVFIPTYSQEVSREEIEIDSLETLASDFYSQGNYAETKRLCTEAMEIIERVFGKENSDYAWFMSILAVSNSALGNYDEAIRLGSEALEIMERDSDKDDTYYAVSLNFLAGSNSNMGNNEEAIRLCTKALAILEKTLGKENPIYAGTLSYLASYNSALGNYDEAKRLCTEAMEIIERTLGKENSVYATSLGSLALYNFYLGNYNETKRLCTEAREIIESVFGKEHPIYATFLSNQAAYNDEFGNYTEAIRLGTEALEITARVVGKEHRDYATSLNNQATNNSHLGNYEDAIRLETEAMEIIERVLGKEHPDYVSCLNNLANYKYALGYYTEAIQLGTEVVEISERVLGKRHPKYATFLGNLALYNSGLGNYEEAIRLDMEELELTERALGKEHPIYATSLNNLSGDYYSLGNYEEAIHLCTEALEIRERVLGKEHPIYALSLGNLAIYNSSLGNYDEAIRLENEALEIREKVLGKEHPDYASSLSELADVYSDQGNYAEAVRLETEALEIFGKTLGKEHPDYARSLSDLAGFNFYSNHYKEASQYAIEYTQLCSQLVRNTFSRLTANERRMFWDKYNYWFEEYLPFYAFYIKDDSLIMAAYNGALMSKGLLLGSEIEMSKLLKKSGDEVAISKYNEMRKNKMQLDKLYETPIAKRYINTDSLERVIDKQEKELVQLSQTYGDYMKNLDINWRQVRDKLGDNDIAIEFLDFNVLTDDSINVYTRYAALTVTRNDSVPHMIPLFMKSELDSIKNKDDYYDSTKLSQLVWKPLAEVLEGKKNIYFSPSGELHSIAIENIPCFEGEGIMSDHWNIYRLSSTRELAMKTEKNEWKNAYIYGDLNYDTDVDVLVADNKKYGNTRGADWEVANFVSSFKTRGAIPLLVYLENTKKEVTDVDSLLRVRNINTTLLTDTLGTEASFKDLDGKSPNVLHIATHGFYWPEKDTVHITNPRQKTRMGNDAGAKYVEDQALTRAYLCFTGAQNALNGDLPPENVDDGILTAKEISELDLRGLDLVVLSACETGLGEITGDGVFGLQRGFFKAGANTLIMSLRGVDDEATQMLMTQFYTNLTNGMTKYEAFRAAQKYLRDHDYADPYFWAAFIIIDAID